MAQYCRYCSYLVTGNGVYCWKKERELSEEQTKRTNRCKEFCFNPMDAYDDGREYQPRQKREKPKPLEYYDGFDFEATNGW